jgi:hypothetical protein
MRIFRGAAALAAAFILTTAMPVGAETTLAWTDAHDGGGAFIDGGYCLEMAPDGNLIVAGESTDLNPGADLFIRKLDRVSGQELWNVRQEGIDDKDVQVTDMTWDSIGQLIVAAFIRGCLG